MVFSFSFLVLRYFSIDQFYYSPGPLCNVVIVSHHHNRLAGSI